jgi:signal transduction histidine kinase
VAGAGLEPALEQAAGLGFFAKLHETQRPYALERAEEGRIVLTTPLDNGSAEVSFSGSTASVINPNSLLVALLAFAAAAVCGALLGRLLRRDLQNANVGVRLLGTETVLRGESRLMARARLSIVADLGRAIEQLAGRFRVFARAQERAIEARERAARMRGLFFASVSHDLKSPLNAILGFTEIVRQTEPITPGQAESLDLIERRGKELLALIETILDAARVEAGQLTLVRDPVPVHELLAEAIDTGKNLGGDRQVELISEIAPGVPMLFVDRLRMPRALSTFIGHAVRNASTPVLRLRAAPDGPSRVRIDVEAPSERFTAKQLQAMLDPNRQPGVGQHRGLALGLSVARSIVELHGGRVQVHEQRGGAVFTVVIPASADVTPAPIA